MKPSELGGVQLFPHTVCHGNGLPTADEKIFGVGRPGCGWPIDPNQETPTATQSFTLQQLCENTNTDGTKSYNYT